MNSLDAGDYFILIFVAVVFIGGGYVVFRFMRNKG